jgi:hypothetical protein
MKKRKKNREKESNKNQLAIYSEWSSRNKLKRKK